MPHAAPMVPVNPFLASQFHNEDIFIMGNFNAYNSALYSEADDTHTAIHGTATVDSLNESKFLVLT